MPVTQEYINPYPGLRAFTEDEGHLFFGRERQIEEILSKLKQSHFLAIIGASGSGKSSLVKSGLISALKQGRLHEEQKSWLAPIVQPGNNPLSNFIDTLHQNKVISLPENNRNEQMANSIQLTKHLHKEISAGETGLLLVIDQFEEIFGTHQSHSKTNETEIFIQTMLSFLSTEHTNIYLVITMRSEYLSNCTEFRALAEVINKGQYLIPRMNNNEIKTVIEKPVETMQLRISPPLSIQLMDDLYAQTDQLPVLQHALMRTFYYWKNNHTAGEDIDLRHYEAVGTMNQALSLHAEEVYLSLETEERKRICQLLFKAFINTHENSKKGSRFTTIENICRLAEASQEEVIDVVNQFRRKGRAFVSPYDDTKLEKDTLIGITHECLMRYWKRYVKWIDEEKQSADLYIRLAKAAALYQEGKIALWRNPELEVAIRWRDNSRPNLAWATRYDPSFDRALSFLDYSKKQYDFELEQKEKQQKLRLKRIRTFAIILGSAAILAIFSMIYAFVQKGEVESQKEQLAGANIALKAQKDSITKQSDILEAQRDSLQQQKEILENQKYILEAQTDSLEKQQNTLITQKNTLGEQYSQIQKQTIELRLKSAQLEKQRDELDKKFKENRRLLAENRKNYLLSVSRNMSNKAIQLVYDNQLSDALRMAVYAHYLNKEKDGPEQNADNFQALNTCFDAVIQQENQPGFYNSFGGHSNNVRSVTYNRKHNFCASADNHGRIILWRLTDKQPVTIKSWKTGEQIRTLCISEDGKYLIAGSLRGQLAIWEIDHTSFDVDRKLRTNFDGIIQHIDFVESGGMKCVFFTSGHSLFVYRFDEEKQSFEPAYQNDNLAPVYAMKVSQDGKFLLVGKNHKAIVMELRMQNNSIAIANERQIPLDDNITALAIEKQHRYFAFGNNRGSIWIVPAREINQPDLKSYKHTEHLSRITDLEFNTESGQLASGSMDNNVRLWKYQNLKNEDRFVLHHDNWIWAIAFEKRHNRLLVCGESSKIKIWHISNQALIEKLCPKVEKRFTNEEWQQITGVKDKQHKYKVPEICNEE